MAPTPNNLPLSGHMTNVEQLPVSKFKFLRKLGVNYHVGMPNKKIKKYRTFEQMQYVLSKIAASYDPILGIVQHVQ